MIYWFPSSQKFQKNHTKAVDITFLCQLASHSIPVPSSSKFRKAERKPELQIFFLQIMHKKTIFSTMLQHKSLILVDICCCNTIISLCYCAVVQNLMSVSVAVITELGDGANTFFWKDRWLRGKCFKEIDPAVFDVVPSRFANKRLVKDAFPNFQWLADLRGALSIRVLADFLDLCEEPEDMVIQPGVQDWHLWKFTASVTIHRARHRALFNGSDVQLLLGQQKGCGNLGFPENASFLFG